MEVAVMAVPVSVSTRPDPLKVGVFVVVTLHVGLIVASFFIVKESVVILAVNIVIVGTLTVIFNFAVSNTVPIIAPPFVIEACFDMVQVIVTARLHVMPFNVAVASVPGFAVDVATVVFVAAPAVPAASPVRPPAGTSSAAPTQSARISNRDFMVYSFR